MTKSPHTIIPAFGHAPPPAHMEGQMKHIHRRDVLRGGGLAALAACSPSMAMAQPRLEDQVLVFADKLLSESAGLSCGEWIERKRIARAVQALAPIR